MKVCYTGKIKEGRKEIIEYVENHGHIFHKAIMWNTDLLVVGQRGAGFDDPKSKKQREAEATNVRIIFVEKLDDMLEYFI